MSRKLLKTYDQGGEHFGYFDHMTELNYETRRYLPDLEDGIVWDVVARDTSDDLVAFLSPGYPDPRSAWEELERIVALIEGKSEPDCAKAIIADRETGEITAPDERLPALELTGPTWVGEWRGGENCQYRSLVQYDPIRKQPMLASAQAQRFTSGYRYVFSGYGCLEFLDKSGFDSMEAAQDACEKAIITAWAGRKRAT